MKYRQNIRLRNYDYASPGAYFITLVTHQRSLLFGDINNGKLMATALGSIAEQHWLNIASHLNAVALDAFTLMPNHLHGILWLNEGSNSLSRIIAFYKAGVTRCAGIKVWQSNFYERVIRRERELMFTRQYIEQNPLRWALDRYHL